MFGIVRTVMVTGPLAGLAGVGVVGTGEVGTEADGTGADGEAAVVLPSWVAGPGDAADPAGDGVALGEPTEMTSGPPCPVHAAARMATAAKAVPVSNDLARRAMTRAERSPGPRSTAAIPFFCSRLRGKS
jgi:hypothetical protein